jgi:hypothetical protein
LESIPEPHTRLKIRALFPQDLEHGKQIFKYVAEIPLPDNGIRLLYLTQSFGLEYPIGDFHTSSKVQMQLESTTNKQLHC